MGKPGGEGKGQYKPPPSRHRSTMGWKVAWVWVGGLRVIAHGFLIAGKCCCMRSIKIATKNEMATLGRKIAPAPQRRVGGLRRAMFYFTA
ncbi:MAG: hypothetical protein LBH44_02730, partial [Treponema sp.]|nr:hypothetical protein [Treponema sp.]